jgi:hypothetical protein
MNQQIQICGKLPTAAKDLLFLYMIKQHAMKMYKTADAEVAKNILNHSTKWSGWSA